MTKLFTKEEMELKLQNIIAAITQIENATREINDELVVIDNAEIKDDDIQDD